MPRSVILSLRFVDSVAKFLREVGRDASGISDSAKGNPQVFALGWGRFRPAIIFVDQLVRASASRLLAGGELDRGVDRFRNSEWALAGVCDGQDDEF